MLTIQQQNKLEEYADLKIQIKALEVKADVLNTEVLEIMQSKGVEEITLGDIGKLTMGSRRKWKYTPGTTKLNEDLKELQKTEQRTGDASSTENKYVIFNSLTEE